MDRQLLLPAHPASSSWLRLDHAEVLKRLHFLERALTRGFAAWIPWVGPLEAKAALAQAAWACSLTAAALQQRVFELRFPSRLMEIGTDAPLVRVFDAVRHAPSAASFFQAVEQILLPALSEAMDAYLSGSDVVSDGPSYRFLRHAQEDIARMREDLGRMQEDPQIGAVNPQWVRELAEALQTVGGVGLLPPQSASIPEILSHGRRLTLPDVPVRDGRYRLTCFYWPDNFDPDYPYGKDVALQVRVALSHLNEVWAVETAAGMLDGLADTLGFAFVLDAARWLYDESRHMTMGQRRFEAWGIEPIELPLGDFIYTACAGQDVIYRLGMLGYFETKNIGKKRQRTGAFRDLGDALSALHMDFDWADESLHAEYGRHWLKALLEARGAAPDAWDEILQHCQDLVAARVAQASEEERAETYRMTEALMNTAERLAAVR